jgi:hypothetical protein
MPKKPTDERLAAFKQRLAETQPTFDELMAREAKTLTDEELRQMVEHSRRERALWDYKEAKAADLKALREGADLDADPEE